ncbi:MAG: FAD-dependent oxidoreductase [bacterium]
MRSIIIGGGVAGCAMAAALGKTTVSSEATIIERRLPGSSAGMGFILLPNGLAALDELAPGINWSDSGHWVTRASLRSSDGAVLSEHALEPSLCVSRERFLRTLHELAGASGRTQFVEGATVEGYERDARAVDKSADARCSLGRAVHLADGTRLEGDLFFGCDGARSRFRSMLFPHAQLSDASVNELVSVADAPLLARELGSTFRKFHDPRGGLAVGMIAESEGRVVWFIQMDARMYQMQGTSAHAFASFADATLADWPAEVLEAIACTNFDDSHLWQTRDLPPLARLSSANAVLLGDAAHACLPFTSQGANGALVDAALLRRLLRSTRTQHDALRAFEEYTRVRRPHHRRMFDEGRRLRDAFLAPVSAQGPLLPLVA